MIDEIELTGRKTGIVNTIEESVEEFVFFSRTKLKILIFQKMEKLH